MLALVAREALRARELTRGAFDPTVGDSLIAAGYDRSFEHLSTTTGPSRAEGGRPDVTIEGDTVRLTGRGALDLGGIAKGWTVDRVAEQLAMAGATGWLVDGGGDIRVGGQAPAGEWHLGIGDDHAIGLTEGAVATSSSLQRRWRTAEGEAHHIIDPRTGQPALGLVDTAVVIARDAGTADVLATALIADFDATWPALARCDAAALVHSAVNGWRMTSNLKELLR